MPMYFVKDGDCGTETAFKIIAAKWKPQILEVCINKGGASYSEIKQHLTRATDAAIVNQLNSLVADGILLKVTIDNDNSFRTVYTISSKALDITPILSAMQQFANKCHEENPIEYVSAIEYSKKLIGSKWKSRILWVIHKNQSIRFNELNNSIEGISHKVLSQLLTDMQENNLVIRTDYNEKSPRVEYRLTTMGNKGYEIVQALAQWCLEYELIKPYITINY